MWLEPRLDPLFHDDSYGYRPGKSALEAIAVTRRRCWDQDWVVEFDIRGLFDNLDHGLLMTALRKHCQEPWILLYVERWLRAPMQSADGQIQARDKGTPQGGAGQSIPALRVRSLGDAASARRPVRPVRRRRRASLQEPTTGGIRARAHPGTVSGLPSRTASGQDTDRVLQGHQSDRGQSRHPVHLPRLHVPTPQGGGQVRPRVCELLAGRQPRRPQGHAADDPGMAGPTEERQEPDRSLGHARTDTEGMAAILRPFPRLGPQVGLASREPVPDRMADAQAQEAGGPQNAGCRNAQTAGATPATRIRPLADGLPVVGWMTGAG